MLTTLSTPPNKHLRSLSVLLLATLLSAGCGSDKKERNSSSSTPTSSISSVSSESSSSQIPEESSSSQSSSTSAPPVTADLSFGFTENIEGWYLNGMESGVTSSSELLLEHDPSEQALKVTPVDWSNNASENWKYSARMDLDEAIDLEDAEIEFEILLPQEYVDDGNIEFQIVVFSDAITPTNSDNYGPAITLSELIALGNNRYKLKRTLSLRQAKAIALQFAKAPANANLKLPIFIKSLLIKLTVGETSSSSSSQASSESSESSVSSTESSASSSDESSSEASSSSSEASSSSSEVSSSSNEASSVSSSSSTSSASSTSSMSSTSSSQSSSSSSSSVAPLDPIDADTTYSFVSGIEGWGRNGGDQSAPFIRVEHDASNDALAMVPLDWGGANNWLYQARTEFGASDLRGSRVSVVVDAPAAYAGSGLNIQLVLQGEGQYTDYWHGGLAAGENTIVWNIAANNDNASSATSFAIQLSTPPTNTALLNPILIKSVEVDVPPLYVPPPPVLTLSPGYDIVYEFASGVEGWTGDDVATSQSGGALVLTPNWSAGWKPAYVVVDGITSKASMEFIVTLTQAHLDAGVTLQPFVQQNSGTYEYLGRDAGGEPLVVGDNRITWTASALDDARRLGLRIQGGDSLTNQTLAIKAVGVNLDPSEQPTPATTVNVDMTSGWWIRDWYSAGRPNPVYASGGRVTYTPTQASDAGDSNLGYTIPGPVNLNSAKFEFELEVSAEYESTELSIQPVIQHQQGAYTGHYGWWISGEEDAVLSGTHCLIAPATGYDMALAENVSLRFQVAKGDAVPGTIADLLPAGSITLRNVKVTLAPTSACP